jgi:hypothetical protein
MNGLALVAAVLVGLSTSASAGVPHLIRYQGQAVDSNGVPLEGPYTLTFRLYNAETAGTVMWDEQQVNIQLSGGHFSVLLGQVNSLQGVNWTLSLWLSVQVNTDPELAPRQRITSVPLAITAEKLAVPVTTSTITDDANRLVPSGAIILWTGASCPTGYTRLSALDDRFLVGGTSYAAAAGGSNTKDISHTHGSGSYAGPNHTHSLPRDGWGIANLDFAGRMQTSQGNGGGYGSLTAGNDNTSGANGTGPVTGTSSMGGSSSLDIRPAYATVLLCKKD